MQALDTHDVFNQFDELTDIDLLQVDAALQEVLQRQQAQGFVPALSRFAQQLGQKHRWEQAELANRHTPELQRFDARGRVLDAVEFHPSWHRLMQLYREQGLISLPFESLSRGRWSAWAAGFYLHGQVEQGSLCPATMTTAAIPVLQKEPQLWSQLKARLFSHEYDASDLPLSQKKSIWIGMGMTEKQGGSDVRANTTVARPVHEGGRGGEYLLRGHKWFFSAPMCDAHLVVARMATASGELGGHACFFVPRWRPDGSKNPVRVQRLKDKVGNRSNSSSEVELQDAWGILMGEEGRGIPTIIEMASYTRLNCVLGSAAIVRSATVQSIAYARQRSAFGKHLADQPLMATVLADLALESEASMQLAMHLAQAYEQEAEGDLLARAWKRIMTPAAKFWVCKRSVEITGEAMEVFGGNGYVQDSIVARLFREAPVNSIWEGSGNVMCLDVLRAMGREPEAARLLLQDLSHMAADRPLLTAMAQSLAQRLSAAPDALEPQARRLVQDLCLLAQACLMHRHAPAPMADGFIHTRLGAQNGAMVVGAFDPAGLDIAAILQRALPA
ncbi:acyl-CoA dehydrogenase family protein [Comamonas testosteroni]|uniref:acyl-CoA dehydrogenase family protein n=1 Tax=Comamonas testosteroni TaxID=285 RepID=UPI0026EB7AF5|nr:acyl-CoA dehydrogenase family protein [Comamonas testosteroni]WQD43326.1 acyl-CoA dehydrogenase family protein [Comamonas testosteroni]